MPVMAVRPNPMNYGSSRCKRFLSCLQRPAVCGEREGDGEREENRKRERERYLGLCSVIQKSIFLSLSLIFIIFLYSISRKNFHYFQLPLDENIILHIKHFEISYEYVTYDCKKEWLPSALIFFKRELEIGYLWKNIASQLHGRVCVKWNHGTFNIFHLCLLPVGAFRCI